jgi:alkylhydroperoxidase/carboxymuconolactone decarboxylase family protein YurZ
MTNTTRGLPRTKGRESCEKPFHFPHALKNGVTQEELGEMIAHLAFYGGWPSAMSAVNEARTLFEKKEKEETP